MKNKLTKQEVRDALEGFEEWHKNRYKLVDHTLEALIKEYVEGLDKPKGKIQGFLPNFEKSSNYYLSSRSKIADDVLNGRHRTSAEMDSHIKCLEYISRIKNYCYEHYPFEPDWSDEDQRKYFVYYNGNEGVLSWECAWHSQRQKPIWIFASQEDVEKALEKFKEEYEYIFAYERGDVRWVK